MAIIYGFILKNRKTFQGIDWQGNQGDLCYKGKTVAWYNDSENGGSCDIVYYDNAYAPIMSKQKKLSEVHLSFEEKKKIGCVLDLEKKYCDILWEHFS